MYIYRITNIINNKIYIGQTTQKNPKMRWYDHCARARKGQCNHLYNSMRLYGLDKFVWEVIDSANTLRELNTKEDYWLGKFREETEVYNLREAGNNKVHNSESIKKMQESQRLAHARRRLEGREGGWSRIDGGPMLGKTHTSETKHIMSLSARGRTHTEETKQKLSMAFKGRIVSEETKQKLRESSIKSWAKRKLKKQG